MRLRLIASWLSKRGVTHLRAGFRGARDRVLVQNRASARPRHERRVVAEREGVVRGPRVGPAVDAERAQAREERVALQAALGPRAPREHARARGAHKVASFDSGVRAVDGA